MFKPIAWIACLTPLALLIYDGFTDNLTANPIEKITNTTGIWTLRLIVATIAISPLRWATGINKLVNYRRLIGLFAFFYASIHFSIYVVTTFFIEGFSNFDASGFVADLVKRPYITAGFTAFVLMIPLTITSTTGWIRRMGGKRWNRLHRLVYITALAAVLHYFWKVKLDATYPVFYAIGVAILLGFRAYRHFAKRAASEV
ncbi:MAG TPA: protein-methionine-sulfoxide reductase heme-binding subunit MsrQ [Vicinamibacterales bacterium]|nr:protein-methionine-sulfoxide reductase heme-binding subunit MsrQ [Vicinamibacterales bacterium]